MSSIWKSIETDCRVMFAGDLEKEEMGSGCYREQGFFLG